MEIRAGEKKSYARVPTRFTRFTLATLAILVTPATAGTLGPAPWPSPHSPRTLPLLCPASKPLSRPLTLVPHHQPQSSRSLISTRFAPSAPNSAPLSPTPSPLPALPTSGVVTCLSRCIYGIGFRVAKRVLPSTPCLLHSDRSLYSSPPPYSARPRRRAAGTSKSWRRRRKRPSPGGGTTTCGGACSLGSARITSPTLSCFPRTTSTRPRGTTYVL